MSTRASRSCLTFVSHHQPPNVVGKTLMVPGSSGSIRSFQTLMAVSGLAASYSSGMRMSVSGPWGAQKSRAALRSSSLGFQVSATDNTPSSNRIRRSPLQLAASGHPSKDTDAWLPMPDVVAAALRIRRTQQDWEREVAGEIWQQTNDMPSLIFTGRYGTPIDPRTLNRKFTARCDAAGVRRLTVHDARHTCATLLVDLDVHRA